MWNLSKKCRNTVIGCFLCVFFATLCNTYLVSAMKAISGEMQVDYSYTMVINEAPFIASMCAALLGISLANKFGKKRIQITGLVIILVSLVFIAASPNIYALSLSKIASGVGVSFVFTTNTSIIADVVEKKFIGEALALNYALTCLGAAAGPLIGMFVLQMVNWRLLTLLLIPICIVIIYILRNNDNVIYEPDSKIDVVPHILFFFGMWCLLMSFFVEGKYSLIFIPGVVMLLAFAYTQWKSSVKIVDGTIFKHKMFIVTCVLGLLFYFAVYCVDNAVVDRLEFYDKDVIVIFGLTVSVAGFGTFLRALKPTIQLIASPTFARLARGRNPMNLTMLAFVILLIAPLGIIWIRHGTTDLTQMAIVANVIFIVLAISSSLFVPHNKGIMIESVEPHLRNTASSISSIVENFGRLLGIIIMVNVIFLLGKTDEESLYISSGLAIIIVIFVSIIGFLLAYRRRKMDY